MSEIEGPDGTVYDLPDEGDRVTVSIEAVVTDVSVSSSRAPVITYAFTPATDRLVGFEYSFYPWEVSWEDTGEDPE